MHDPCYEKRNKPFAFFAYTTSETASVRLQSDLASVPTNKKHQYFALIQRPEEEEEACLRQTHC